MNISKHRLELPPEAEPARDFIEALVARYESQIKELNQQVQSLSEQVQSLTERLKKPNPRNSSLPPSSEHPHGKPPRKSSKRRIRKQGGQEGHKRHLRELVPIEQCEAVISCVPDSCRRCGGLVRPDESQPIRLQTELANQSQLYVDESPTKQHKAKAWLWVAVAPMFAVFGIFANRSRESLVALIGDYSKIILNCDRAKMYLDGPRLQWCWAHLKRDIKSLRDSHDKQVKRLGHDLMRQERLLFEYWQRYKRAEVNWKAFRRLASPVRKEFNSLLLRGSYSGNAKLIGFCDEILPRKDHLWTFLDAEGIEPTNTAAERALRSAVILRKLSFGTQSSQGSRYLERILSLSETCRLQKRNAYEYLMCVMKAKFAGETAPSQLPLIEDHPAAA